MFSWNAKRNAAVRKVSSLHRKLFHKTGKNWVSLLLICSRRKNSVKNSFENFFVHSFDLWLLPAARANKLSNSCAKRRFWNSLFNILFLYCQSRRTVIENEILNLWSSKIQISCWLQSFTKWYIILQRKLINSATQIPVALAKKQLLHVDNKSKQLIRRLEKFWSRFRLQS